MSYHITARGERLAQQESQGRTPDPYHYNNTTTNNNHNTTNANTDTNTTTHDYCVKLPKWEAEARVL